MAFEETLKNEPAQTWSLTRRLVKNYARPYWGSIGLSLLFMILAAIMTAALAKLMEPVIDQVFTAKNQALLWPVAGGVFFAFVVRGVSTYAHTVLTSKVGQGMIADIQRDLFHHLIRADLAFHHKNPSGQIISRMVADTTVMRSALADSLTGIGKSFFTLLFLIVVMFHQDWVLSSVSLFVFPLAALFVAKLGRKLRKVSTSTQEETGHFSNVLNQTFQGVRQAKAYGREAYEEDRAGHLIKRLYNLAYKRVRVSALSTPLSEVLTACAIVAVIVYGGHQVIEGHKTSGQLFSFITAFLLAYEPMKRLAKLSNAYQIGLAAVDRVFQILDIEPEIKDEPEARVLDIDVPEISIENVAFVYPDGTKALSDISLSVQPGKTIALVGPSGGGKSTLLNLIPRFYDVSSGAIKVDGIDIRHIRMDSLRENLALVSQEVTIFDDTIAANIRYGRLDATDFEVEAAARAAAAHDFIKNLPEGYDTLVGDQGLKLSGGQRQRIAIARAMLRDAPILLLDEATSALDSESERAIQAALVELKKNRSTLVVAHRLSTIVNADLIYVLNSGGVVEQGTHEELLAKDGLYARLYGSGLDQGVA